MAKQTRLQRATSIESDALGMFREAHDKLGLAQSLYAEQLDENTQLIEVLQNENVTLTANHARADRVKTRLAEFLQ